MASLNLNRPELVFDMDDIPMAEKPDFHNEFVFIKDSESSYGLVPDWYGECCSELRDPPDAEEKERDIFYPRLTGKQLHVLESMELGDYTDTDNHAAGILEKISELGSLSPLP